MRDNFSTKDRAALAKRAAYICSNPACRAHTLAPSDANDEKFLYVGKVAHICAAASGGPRFDAGMSANERGAIANGIFLCATCADVIDKNGGVDYPAIVLRGWKIEHEQWVSRHLNRRAVGSSGAGGDGGGGYIQGNNGVAIGGPGGNGGVGGSGGRGGSGFVIGDDGFVAGGNGGNAATGDGRAGRSARGPTERFGFPTSSWGFGRGGTGSNAPEYDRRIALLRQFRAEYFQRFPYDFVFVEAGIDRVPADWINQRLLEIGELWRVEDGPDGYVMPLLSSNET